MEKKRLTICKKGIDWFPPVIHVILFESHKITKDEKRRDAEMENRRSIFPIERL